MKLSTTFSIGAGLAVVPLVIGLAFAVDRLQDLASQSERLLLRQLTAVRLGTGVGARLDRLRDYQSKYAVSNDGGYRLIALETAAAIDGEVLALESAALGPIEDRALSAFLARWRVFYEGFIVDGDARSVDDDDLQRRALDALIDDAAEFLASAHSAAVADVKRANDARAQASRAAVIATLVALLSSATVLAFVVRRTRRRLDAFVSASAAVSKGSFTTQMDVGGDDELSRLALAFNHMVVALDQLERMKSDFTSSISHELRTPLVAMVETNEALLDDVAGPLTAQQRRMIDLNRGAALRLSAMLGDLLELSVIKSGLRYRLAEVELTTVLNDAVAELDARARDRKLGLTLSMQATTLPLVGDADRLIQALQNIVENAIKYTPEGGAIAVDAVVVDSADVAALSGGPQGKVAVVRVADSGPGIPEVDRDRVFEKFFRRQGVSADGTGLGLAICREIVHAHRGAVWIDDAALGGAQVNIALPLRSQA
jgi:signal transduction histidine kinase